MVQTRRSSTTEDQNDKIRMLCKHVNYLKPPLDTRTRVLGSGTVEAVREEDREAALLQPLGCRILSVDESNKIVLALTFGRGNERVNNDLCAVEEVAELCDTG